MNQTKNQEPQSMPGPWLTFSSIAFDLGVRKQQEQSNRHLCGHQPGVTSQGVVEMFSLIIPCQLRSYTYSKVTYDARNDQTLATYIKRTV